MVSSIGFSGSKSWTAPSVATYRSTANQIVAYTVVVCALSLVFVPVAEMGVMYTVAAVVSGAAFLAITIQLRRAEGEPAERRAAIAISLFRYSITYVTLLFGAMAVDQLVQSGW